METTASSGLEMENAAASQTLYSEAETLSEELLPPEFPVVSDADAVL